MRIIPAIDLRGGRAVRLVQGDTARETDYGDPLVWGRKWKEAGATMLHVVDLDGAKTGIPHNWNIVASLIAETGLAVQVSGGMRKPQFVDKAFRTGASFVVLSTLLSNFGRTQYLLKKYLGKIVAAVDVREGHVVTHGWGKETRARTLDYLDYLAAQNIDRFNYTDTMRDGTERGPNFVEVEKVVMWMRKRRNSVATHVTVGGGIATIEHLKDLKGLGVESVIIGKALSEGTLDYREALQAVT